MSDTTLPVQPAPIGRSRESGPSPAGAATRAAVLVVVAAGAGCLGGWLWWRWWAPAPEGRVFELLDGGTTWAPTPAEAGYDQLSAATPQYVVIGLGFGLLLGVLAAVLLRGRELVGLAALVVASGLGAFLMLRLGVHLSPPDPESLLADAAVGDRMPGAMAVSGWTPYLAWPFGALFGFLAVLVLVTERSAPARHR
jgi:hypothetical protein